MDIRRAFSLVELSIVLVILGLLVGGILAGQSLIRAAELRSVISDYQRYKTATATFRDMYFGLPGDITSATLLWGKDNAACTGHSGTAATPGTCNGDGDLVMEQGAANGTSENFQFWKQLSLAGLIEGTYSGLSGPGSGHDAVLGTNTPRSRINTAGWSTRGDYGNNFAGDAWSFAGNYGNIDNFGSDNGVYGMEGAVLEPEEAWNIDTKLDDGKPGMGMVYGQNWGACSTATSATDRSKDYKLDTTSAVCSLWFLRQH